MKSIICFTDWTIKIFSFQAGQSCRSALKLGGAAAPPYRRREEFRPASFVTSLHRNALSLNPAASLCGLLACAAAFFFAFATPSLDAAAGRDPGAAPSFVTGGAAPSADIPRLEKRDGMTKLIVDGRPFICVAGELANSSSTDVETMKPPGRASRR